MLSYTEGERIAKIVDPNNKTNKQFLYFKDIHDKPGEINTNVKDLFKSKFQLDTVLDELCIEKYEFSIIINLISQNIELPANINKNIRRAYRRLQNIISRKLKKEIHFDINSSKEIVPIVLDDKKFSHHISVFGATSSGKKLLGMSNGM